MEAETLSKSKLDIKDFIKNTSSGNRLQSLRLPRDLSLGGTKSSKKNYKPNLNVVRNKDKAKVLMKRAHKSKIKPSLIQDKPKDRFMQSPGVFSEGIGDPIRLPHNRISVRNREKTPPIKQEYQRVDRGLDSKVFQEILKFDDSSDEEVTVPFKPIYWCPSKLLNDPLKKDAKPEESDVENLLPSEYADSTNNSELPLTLWQLPDSLPFKNLVDNSKNKKLNDCKLSDLPEGKIGRICVHRSGKIDVYIGSVEYELEPAVVESCVEEVVSVNVSPSQETRAIVLGKMNNKFLLCPSWSSLID